MVAAGAIRHGRPITNATISWIATLNVGKLRGDVLKLCYRSDFVAFKLVCYYRDGGELRMRLFTTKTKDHKIFFSHDFSNTRRYFFYSHINLQFVETIIGVEYIVKCFHIKCGMLYLKHE